MGTENRTPRPLNYANQSTTPGKPSLLPVPKMMKRWILITFTLAIVFVVIAFNMATIDSGSLSTSETYVVPKPWWNGLLILIDLFGFVCLFPLILFLARRRKLFIGIILLLFPIGILLVSIVTPSISDRFKASGGKMYYSIINGTPTGDPDTGEIAIAMDEVDLGYAKSYRIVSTDFGVLFSPNSAIKVPANTPDGKIIEGPDGRIYIVYENRIVMEYQKN